MKVWLGLNQGSHSIPFLLLEMNEASCRDLGEHMLSMLELSHLSDP